MTKQLNAAFKEQLLAQRASLMAQLRDLRGGTVGRAEASAEHFSEKDDSTAQDSGASSSARELEFALDAHDSEELDRLDAALRRIEDGSYGLCVDCGVGIAAARLHAAPDALRCIACQEKFEKRQAQRS